MTASARRQAVRVTRAERRRMRARLVGPLVLAALILLAALAPLLADRDGLSVTQATGPVNHPPSLRYPLGTEENGRSVLLLMVYGAQTSLSVGVSATLLAVGFGTVVGLLSGHFPGWRSAALRGLTDFFLALPSLLLAIILSTVLWRGVGAIILAITVTSWAVTARLVRAQTLAIEARPHVERARALGGGHGHVIVWHTLPGVLPVILATATLTMADAIIAESTLSFLGLGDPSAISWGSMLNTARKNGAITAGQWWYVLPPGLAIVVVVLAVTTCGRALEVAVNPALRQARAAGRVKDRGPR